MITKLPKVARQILLSALAVTALAASSSYAATEDSAALASAAQQALNTKMGEAAKDLTVVVTDGDASIRGWVRGPVELQKARYIVSQVPGVQHAYSSAVKTWSSTNTD